MLNFVNKAKNNFLLINFMATKWTVFLINALSFRLAIVDCSAIPSVQQKLRATIANHLYHSLKWFSQNKFRVQYHIIVCHRMFSLKESEKVKRNVVYLVKNLIQKKSLIQCMYFISCYINIIIHRYMFLHFNTSLLF